MTVTVGEIEKYLRERIAQDLEVGIETIQVDTDLTDMGMSSVLISFIEGDVEAWLGVEIPPALLFQTSNIREAARAITALQPEPQPQPEDIPAAPVLEIA
ncbi:MAG TPA: acyl carrier protein [Steroidobacteraceae bacterium]|jgi:acyl carrier protein|nr:acyl carrier protein [Steroidobacteraceae bacterium]